MEYRYRLPFGDRRHYVDEEDVAIVLSRLPEELTRRIRAVHFTDEARGNRTLGYVSTRGRREIALCALPPRVSLNHFVRQTQGALTFGAVRGTQWPALAVRRFMLYDVLLHEVGHLQVVDEGARRPQRRFASETRAQDFADSWRAELWSRSFVHPDPVHNPPGEEEVALLALWPDAHEEYRRGLGAPDDVARSHFRRAIELFPEHAHALTELATRLVREALRRAPDGPRVEHARTRAAALLERALRVDPTSFDANLRMGWNCGHLGRYDDARRYLARALRHGRLSVAGLRALGAAYAEWGFLVEAERFFAKGLARAPDDVRLLSWRARAVWDLGRGDQDVRRALELFERAVECAPDDARAHFHLALALATIPGEVDRARHHVAIARALGPDDEDIAALDARLIRPLAKGQRARLQRETCEVRRFDRATGAVVLDR